MYAKIINPKTGRLVNVDGVIGRNILNKYNVEQNCDIHSSKYIPIPVVKHKKCNLVHNKQI
jgi:hypothetical protein